MRKGAVLAMGVFLGASTKIVDRVTGETFIGEVPEYSVVVPGALPGKPLKNGQPGPSTACAVIVKRVDERTRSKTSINELLRIDRTGDFPARLNVPGGRHSMAARSLWYGLDLVSLPLRRPHQPRLVLAGAADCPAVDRSARLIGQAIHLLNGQRSFTSSLTFSSDFALDDLFKVVDPRAYRLLPSADRPTLIPRRSARRCSCGFTPRLRSSGCMIATGAAGGSFRSSSCPACSASSRTCCPTPTGSLRSCWSCKFPWLWGFVEMFCLHGSLGSNRFGPDPLAEVEDNAASTPPPQKAGTSRASSKLSRPAPARPAAWHVKRST